jgi:hypothetical protein
LQISAGIADGLARDVQKYSLRSRRNSHCERQGIGKQDPVSCRREAARKAAMKELAPGGHQEQGESRITEFRAPDWGKTQGAEVVARTATAPFGEEYQRLRMNAT